MRSVLQRKRRGVENNPVTTRLTRRLGATRTISGVISPTKKTKGNRQEEKVIENDNDTSACSGEETEETERCSTDKNTEGNNLNEKETQDSVDETTGGILSIEELAAAETSKGLFADPLAQQWDLREEEISGINSESSAAHAEVQKYKKLVEELKNRNSELEDNGNIKKLEKVKLDITQEASLSGNWGSFVFQGLKYANDKTLTFDNPNRVLKRAFAALGMETEGQRGVYKEAVKHYLKYRIGRMRDYFVTKVQGVVMNMGK
jgi:hypothetical protein